jgi:drug/metabolite transporter (DMT)-like permease
VSHQDKPPDDWTSPRNAAARAARKDGYTVFAVALGILVGTIWHRMLPAMAATLAGFVVVRIAIDTLARPRYLDIRRRRRPHPVPQRIGTGTWRRQLAAISTG